ncbi:glycosyltransferase [Streptomyces gobiensis]|uniref:glycosyltransferase n=1 Tax=Streptomyces gobiensis TaxID=2875706 RepID=UPI001E651970|nr:glycosyltransferase [Streptomyces gobiensis]UGY92996.1 glycosyltransferase [Streptomyces gobiensis]
MRILFVGGNGAGTLFPLIPLAQATRNAGHEVFMTGPEALAGDIAGAGLPPVVVTDRSVADFRIPGLGNTAPVSEEGLDSYLAIGRMFGGYAADCLDPLLRLADDWRPDLVVGVVLAYAAPLVAHHAGVPFVRFATDLAEPAVTNLAAAAQLGLEMERFGLYEMPRPALSISVCPSAARPAVVPPALPMRHIPYTSQRPVEPWLHSAHDRPRVLVSAGSRVTPDHDFDILDGLVRATSSLDAELLIAAPEAVAEKLRPLPAHARADWIPLDTAMPTINAMVHHGGGSTTLAGMAHGVPQILIPHMLGLDYTHRLAELGSAKLITPEEDTADTIVAAVEEVLGNASYRDAADRLRSDMNAMPGPAELVPSLESLANSGP